mmetsp:Transcript_35239/g.91532  ORF Transcript_35239/g.91532 Transcript_35239/m.91532 type:complete len:143 (-) Transcript_35239:764-1192(-)
MASTRCFPVTFKKALVTSVVTSVGATPPNSTVTTTSSTSSSHSNGKERGMASSLFFLLPLYLTRTRTPTLTRSTKYNSRCLQSTRHEMKTKLKGGDESERKRCVLCILFCHKYNHTQIGEERRGIREERKKHCLPHFWQCPT